MPYKPFDTSWTCICQLFIQFFIINLSIIHNKCLLILWLYHWSMMQYLLCSAKAFIWIASAVISFKQCMYKNSSFCDIMYLAFRSVTPTLQNVSSVMHTGLESNCIKYHKTPWQGIRWQQCTCLPNSISGWHGITYNNTSGAHCNGLAVLGGASILGRSCHHQNRRLFQKNLLGLLHQRSSSFYVIVSGINYPALILVVPNKTDASTC